jgi:hypothetical protein
MINARRGVSYRAGGSAAAQLTRVPPDNLREVSVNALAIGACTACCQRRVTEIVVSFFARPTLECVYVSLGRQHRLTVTFVPSIC